MKMLALLKGSGQLSSACSAQPSLLENARFLVRLLQLCQRNTLIHTPTPGFTDRKTFKKWEHPSVRSQRWEPLKSMKEIYGYTADPVPLPKTGGRGPNGRIWRWRVGGGFQKYAYMVDWVRGGPSSGDPLIERVLAIETDDVKSAKLALVAAGERKRWIVATTNMKVGDCVKSSTDKSITDLKTWGEGDSLPLACIPQGTLVHCIQNYPGRDGRMVSAGGAVAQVVRHANDKVVIRLPSGQEILVSNECTATLGKAAKKDNAGEKMYKAGQNRWRGVRPQSGLWHRKTGRFGRKEKVQKNLKEYTTAPTARPPKPRRLFNDVAYS